MYFADNIVQVMRKPGLLDPKNAPVGELSPGLVEEVELPHRLSTKAGALSAQPKGSTSEEATVFIGRGWVPRAQLIPCKLAPAGTDAARYGEYIDFNAPSRCVLASYSTTDGSFPSTDSLPSAYDQTLDPQSSTNKKAHSPQAASPASEERGFKRQKWFRPTEPLAVLAPDGVMTTRVKAAPGTEPHGAATLPHFTSFPSLLSKLHAGGIPAASCLVPLWSPTQQEQEILSHKPSKQRARPRSAAPREHSTAKRSLPRSQSPSSQNSRSKSRSPRRPGDGTVTSNTTHSSNESDSTRKGSLSELRSSDGFTLKLDGNLEDAVRFPPSPILIGRGASGTVRLGFLAPPEHRATAPQQPSAQVATPDNGAEGKLIQQVFAIARAAFPGAILAKRLAGGTDETPETCSSGSLTNERSRDLASGSSGGGSRRDTCRTSTGSRSQVELQQQYLHAEAQKCNLFGDVVVTVPTHLESDAELSDSESAQVAAVAVKTMVVPQTDSRRANAILHEISTMRRCQHPNIVKLYGAYRDGPSRVALAMELCDGGTLQDLIDQYAPLEEWECASIMRALFFALFYLHHSLQVVHRDVKPSNIFLTLRGEVKLGDLGVVQSKQSAQTFCGTNAYMAPEVQTSVYDEKVDAWSAGVVLQYMLTGQQDSLGRQWLLSEPQAAKKGSKSGATTSSITPPAGAQLPPGYVLRSTLRNTLCAETVDFVNSLVEPNPEKRLSIAEVFRHGFLVRYQRHYCTEFLRFLCQSTVANWFQPGSGSAKGSAVAASVTTTSSLPDGGPAPTCNPPRAVPSFAAPTRSSAARSRPNDTAAKHPTPAPAHRLPVADGRRSMSAASLRTGTAPAERETRPDPAAIPAPRALVPRKSFPGPELRSSSSNALSDARWGGPARASVDASPRDSGGRPPAQSRAPFALLVSNLAAPAPSLAAVHDAGPAELRRAAALAPVDAPSEARADPDRAFQSPNFASPPPPNHQRRDDVFADANGLVSAPPTAEGTSDPQIPSIPLPTLGLHFGPAVAPLESEEDFAPIDFSASQNVASQENTLETRLRERGFGARQIVKLDDLRKLRSQSPDPQTQVPAPAAAGKSARASSPAAARTVDELQRELHAVSVVLSELSEVEATSPLAPVLTARQFGSPGDAETDEGVGEVIG